MPIIFGIHPVREALLDQSSAIDLVYVQSRLTGQRLAELRQLARERNICVREVPAEALLRFSEGGHHQGIAARLKEFSYASMESILDGPQPPDLLLLLDDIEDPHNLGAILRSAEAAGVQGVFIPERRAAGVTPAVLRASAGAAAHVAVCRVTNLVPLIEQLKEKGYWITGLDGEAETLWTAADFRLPTALVLGSEGKGIRPLIRRHCDWLVRLPMRGRVSSLNVSVAAGIVLYEVLRQRQGKTD